MARNGSGASPLNTFREQVEIVDLYRARVHLGTVAELLYGSKDTLCQAWLSARREELDEGNVEAVVAAMDRRRLTNAEVQKELEKDKQYFRGNAERMRYAKFRSQGLFVGSGRRRGWVQDHLRPAPKILWHALDGPGRQCHHRIALLPTQWTLGRVLGIPSGQLIG